MIGGEHYMTTFNSVRPDDRTASAFRRHGWFRLALRGPRR